MQPGDGNRLATFVLKMISPALAFPAQQGSFGGGDNCTGLTHTMILTTSGPAKGFHRRTKKGGLVNAPPSGLKLETERRIDCIDLLFATICYHEQTSTPDPTVEIACTARLIRLRRPS